MGTIFFCGDPHGEFSHIINAVEDRRPSAVILLGDQESQRPLEIELEAILRRTELWWIPGNHDTDSVSSYENLFESALSDRNLHGRIVEIAGLKIAGLGGVFRGQVWNPQSESTPRFENANQYLAKAGKGNLWRSGLPLKHRSTIFPDTYRHLLLTGDQKSSVDILVTHEAPDLHRHGFKEITDLANALAEPTKRRLKAFHGHHHEHVDYEGLERFDAHSVGFRGIAMLDIEAWMVVTIHTEHSYLGVKRN